MKKIFKILIALLLVSMIIESIIMREWFHTILTGLFLSYIILRIKNHNVILPVEPAKPETDEERHQRECNEQSADDQMMRYRHHELYGYDAVTRQDLDYTSTTLNS